MLGGGGGLGGGGSGGGPCGPRLAATLLAIPPLSFTSASFARTRLDTFYVYGCGGRDWQGGHATAAEEMDGAMADCGGGGAGAGQSMAEAGK